jgi:hypothetical protein
MADGQVGKRCRTSTLTPALSRRRGDRTRPMLNPGHYTKRPRRQSRSCHSACNAAPGSMSPASGWTWTWNARPRTRSGCSTCSTSAARSSRMNACCRIFTQGRIVPRRGVDQVIGPILDAVAKPGRSPAGAFIAGSTGTFWDESSGIPVLGCDALERLLRALTRTPAQRRKLREQLVLALRFHRSGSSLSCR